MPRPKKKKKQRLRNWGRREGRKDRESEKNMKRMERKLGEEPNRKEEKTAGESHF